MISHIDYISAEIDLRKAQSLIEQGVITPEEIASALIVFKCSCGREQSVGNNLCEACGKNIFIIHHLGRVSDERN